MKVLHILGSLNIGGAENLIANLLETANTTESPYKYSVVYMHKSNNKRVELFTGNATNVTLIECNKGLKSTLKFIKALRKHIVKNNIDIIHCHNNIDAYWAYLASINTKVKKVVLTIHGLNLDFNFLKNKFKIFPGADNYICKHLVKTYVSKVTRDYYLSKYPQLKLDGCTIYNGVKFHPQVLTEDFVLNKQEHIKSHPLSNQSWIKPSKPVFGMVGNFNTPVRLQAIICKAIEILKNRFNGSLPFTFIFIGAQNAQNPHLYNECVEICTKNGSLNNNVFFLGAQDNAKELFSLLSGYVYCSSGDTFGLSVIEAIGAALPTVCSNIETFREILHNGKYGYLVNNSPEDIADAMQMLYNNISNKKEPVLDGVLNMAPFIVRDIYSLEKCLAAYQAIYQE